MNKTLAIVCVVSLAFFAVTLLPSASAASLPRPPPVCRACAVPLDQGITEGDSDGDGYDEASGHAVFGFPCGCNCPVVGGGLHIEAAGSKATVAGAAVANPLCGVGAWFDVDPGQPDPTAEPVVQPIVICYGGGLGPCGGIIGPISG